MDVKLIPFSSTYRMTKPNPALSFLSSSQYRFLDDETTIESICFDHDHELLKPQLTSTWMPNAVGSTPGQSVIFAETQVRVTIHPTGRNSLM